MLLRCDLRGAPYPRSRDAFDSRNSLTQHTRARRDAIDVHGARAAQRHATTEFGARHRGNIMQCPQQRHVVRDVERTHLAGDFQLDHSLSPW
jgi:hypothetical protein